MALIKCTECGQEISDAAEACPKCGAPQDLAARPVKCPDCGTMVPGTVDACPKCGRPIERTTMAKNFGGAMGSSLSKLTGGIKVKGKVTASDIFRDLFKKHRTEDVEDTFTKGTKYNPVDVKKITSADASAWAWSRVLLVFLALVAIFAIGYLAIKVTTLVGGFIFACAFALPLAMVVFFHEIDILHNITFHKTLLYFLIGGAAAIIITVFESQVFKMNSNDLIWQCLLISLTEEVAKTLIIAGIISVDKKANYILDGLLIGSAVGAGFAGFETMGYLAMAGSTNQMTSMAFQRAILSLGMHLAWGALEGAGIMMAKGYKKRFSWSNLASVQVLVAFIIPFLFHWLWDVVAMNTGTNASNDDWVPYVLTLVIWVPIIYTMNVGFAQAIEAKNYYLNLATVAAANQAEKVADAKKSEKTTKKTEKKATK